MNDARPWENPVDDYHPCRRGHDYDHEANYGPDEVTGDMIPLLIMCCRRCGHYLIRRMEIPSAPSE